MLLVASLAWMACGGGPPPSAGVGPPPPNLAGSRVIVFPVQGVSGLAGDVDAELAFALQSSGGGVDWVLPDELREALRTSPALDAPLEGLPVRIFLQAEVNRVGDPLYGVVRRLSALTRARVALIPVIARYRVGAPPELGAAELGAAVLDARTGRVLWFGFQDGRPGSPDDPGVMATAAEALARALSGG